jgi:dUTP pyrophosphatase
MKVKVQVFNKSKNALPEYATIGSAGIDLLADLQSFPNIHPNDKVLIQAGSRKLIPTGLHMAIPEGFELQIRPRSGLALKKGISIVNTPGTIDSDYRGEVGVILINHGEEAVGIGQGDKICQAVLKRVDQLEWDSVDKLEDLSSTDRGQGGFGSTDNKELSLPFNQNN